MENNSTNSNTSNQKTSAATPPPRTLDYNSVCQMIGHLYIELNNSRSSIDNNYTSIIENLTSQVSELISENEELKEQLAPDLDKDKQREVL